MANSIILGRVKGEQGATGVQGATGQPGANGITPDIRNGTWWLGSIDTGVTAKGNEWYTGTDNPTTQGVNGDLYLNTTTADVFKKANNVWELVLNIKGQRGEQGLQGERGASALTIAIGSVTTAEADEQASVSNSGTEQDIILDFVIPKGEQGEPGQGAGTKVFVGGFEQNTLSFETDPQTQINELKRNAGTGYTAGNGIDIIDNAISVKQSVLDNIDSKIGTEKITNSMLNTTLTDKIPTESAVAEYIENTIENLPTGGADYTAGTGIDITDNTISVADNVMMTDKANVITGGSLKIASSPTSSQYTIIDNRSIVIQDSTNFGYRLYLYPDGLIYPLANYRIMQEFNDVYNYGLHLSYYSGYSGKGVSKYRYSFTDLIPAEPSSKIEKRMTDTHYKPYESIVILCNNEDVQNDYKAGHLYRIDVDTSVTPYTHTITDITPVSNANISVGTGSSIVKKTFSNYADLYSYLVNKVTSAGYKFDIVGLKINDPMGELELIQNIARGGGLILENGNVTYNGLSYGEPVYSLIKDFVFSGYDAETNTINFLSNGTKTGSGVNTGYISTILSFEENNFYINVLQSNSGNVPVESKFQIGQALYQLDDMSRDTLSTIVEIYELQTTEFTTEKYTIASSGWTAVAGVEPFAYQTTVTASYAITDDTEVGIVNNNPILFAQYGFVVASVSGQSITIYATKQPTDDVELLVEYRG